MQPSQQASLSQLPVSQQILTYSQSAGILSQSNDNISSTYGFDFPHSFDPDDQPGLNDEENEGDSPSTLNGCFVLEDDDTYIDANTAICPSINMSHILEPWPLLGDEFGNWDHTSLPIPPSITPPTTHQQSFFTAHMPEPSHMAGL
jgi:hypothetical protein